jgi:hypothetical protein
LEGCVPVEVSRADGEEGYVRRLPLNTYSEKPPHAVLPSAGPGGRYLKLFVASIRKNAIPLAAVGALLCVTPVATAAHVDVGVTLEDTKLEAVSGGKQPLLGKAEAHVLLFFRPGQDRSIEVLREIAACEKTLASKSVRLVGVVSSSAPIDEVEKIVREVGLVSPVLLDLGDQLYSKLEIRQQPIAVLVGKDHQVVAFQPYTRLRYCDLLMAHIQLQLKEISPAEHAAVLVPPKAVMPNDDVRSVANRHVNLGERYLLKGNCILALVQFDEALALEPGNAKAMEGKKKCEAALKK